MISHSVRNGIKITVGVGLLFCVTRFPFIFKCTRETMATQIDDEYWKKKWDSDDIGFHRSSVHPSLIKYMKEMTAGQEKCKVLVPLCGKSLDLKWLADQGHTVIGVELSSVAIHDFFKENNLEYSTQPVEGLKEVDLYTSKDSRILLYKANLFDLTKEIIGECECIWDRASIVALPRSDLQRYADLMTTILKPKGICLMETLQYDQSKMSGPPFSTPLDTVHKHYDDNWEFKFLQETDALIEKWKRRGLSAFDSLTILLTKKDK